MKNTSTGFNTIAESPFGAKYILKIIDLTTNKEIKADIDDFLYSAMINDDDVFTIGNTCSATISFSIINPTVNLNNKEIKVYQGLDINGTVEYVELGVFKVLKPKKDRNITKYQCVDRMTYLMNMPYSSNLTFPTTDVKILEEICSQVGISLVQNGLISHSISKSPSGYTRREIIAYMSQLQGKNAKINSDGNLEIIWYTDANYVIDDNKIYYDGTSDVNSEIDYKVEYLECTVRSLDGTDETVIKAGSGANGIKIENPFMTQTILYELANKLVGFTFRGAEFEFLGDFRLEVGDVVSVETNGEVYRVPIMQIEHKSDGGVVTTITSVGETDTENEIDLSSPSIKAMDRYYAELVLINKAMINKLSVDKADIRYLQVEQLDVIEANIENAVIENLEGKYVTAEELDAEKARITVLEANSLNADSAIIKDLQAGVTKTNTLIFGSASGDTIQTSFSNSVIAQLGDAQIESAMIKEISALKITGLDLNTTKFTVHSEDGLSYWEDNTIVMHDGVLGTPRIQIGKDGSGDYNVYIWNAQGKLMFDALGLTENGVVRQIIRNDVVKDDANINAAKLNIESLFNVINDETSYMLKSSKIWIDSEKQTLDVSFKVMSSNVSDLQETQISQGTDIETIQGQISSKIWQQDITTAIDDVNEDITSLTTKYSLLEQNVDSFKTTVSETYATLSFGNRNYLTNSNFVNNFDGWGNTQNRYVIDDTKLFEGVKSAKISRSGLTANAFSYLWQSYKEIVQPGDTFTTSAYYYTDDVDGIDIAAPRLYLDFYDADKNELEATGSYISLNLENGKWVRNSLTRVAPEGAVYVETYICRLSRNGTLWIAKPQLEKSSKATDWTLAEEDIVVEMEATKSVATQTSNMINWMVASGTSESDFTLTDRMAELTAQIINLNGNVKVSGDMLVDGAITADKLSTDAIKSRNYTEAVGTFNPLSGSKLDLSDGSFKSVNLKWDSTGYFTGTKGKIGDWHVSSKLYSSLSAYIPPTKKDLDKIKKYLLGQVTLTNDELEYYDLNNDGLVDALDMTNVKRILIGVTRYEDYDGKIRSPLNIDINALDGSKTIKFTATNPLGEEIESYLGATQCYFPAINGGYIYGDILEGSEANISGPLIVNDKVEMHGNGLELYYTTPYIDFHYNNDTTDHTARIAENSKGALTVYNTISNASDERLKQDICNLDRRYLNALKLFNPVSYRFIKGSDNLNLGFVAQGVKKALIDSGITDLPIVSQDNDGIYSLDYNQITALNTLGHLDHEKRIQQLENDLAIANALIQNLLLQQSSV